MSLLFKESGCRLSLLFTYLNLKTMIPPTVLTVSVFLSLGHALDSVTPLFQHTQDVGEQILCGEYTTTGILLDTPEILLDTTKILLDTSEILVDTTEILLDTGSIQIVY